MNDALLGWYALHGRHDLPWRRDPSPYRVVVSEFMLQQTQVERVIPIFNDFVTRFRSFGELAAAPTSEVVRAWRGLGYNTRAVRLHRVAVAVVERHGEELPSEREALLALPGIGPYTASAIRAFAFNLDDVALDTNLRRIGGRVGTDLAVPAGFGFTWNSALMDLGATICTARTPKCLLCPLQDGCAAAPLDGAMLASVRRAPRGTQKRFEETTRYARGRIVDYLRSLPPERAISLLDLSAALAPQLAERGQDEIANLVRALERDGLVHCADEQVRLA